MYGIKRFKALPSFQNTHKRLGQPICGGGSEGGEEKTYPLHFKRTKKQWREGSSPTTSTTTSTIGTSGDGQVVPSFSMAALSVGPGDQ
uniref:Uncharacterized protein n=1 Tax=Ditylenchus dipsaci TaxID=166011 RepID=A0A915D5T4_9BILA